MKAEIIQEQKTKIETFVKDKPDNPLPKKAIPKIRNRFFILNKLLLTRIFIQKIIVLSVKKCKDKL